MTEISSGCLVVPEEGVTSSRCSVDLKFGVACATCDTLSVAYTKCATGGLFGRSQDLEVSRDPGILRILFTTVRRWRYVIVKHMNLWLWKPHRNKHRTVHKTLQEKVRKNGQHIWLYSCDGHAQGWGHVRLRRFYSTAFIRHTAAKTSIAM